MQPLFIFSLPRSGSTLLQRLLAVTPAISTISEPWLLLPQIYALKEKGIFTEYSHTNAFMGISEFCNGLPGGQESYRKELRLFISRLYELAADDGAEYFLDKTPRYSLVAGEIINLFPDGKFIFLWRNPLAVCASMQQTWANGKWNLYNYHIDLFKGLEKSLSTYQQNRHKVYSLRFEDLISNPQKEITSIFKYLELPYNDKKLTNSTIPLLAGSMGDQIGTKKYSSINKEPITKWKAITRNPLRKIWAKRYLSWIGEDRLQLMGYDFEILLKELHETPKSFRYLLSDIFRFTGGICCSFIEYPIIKQKLTRTQKHIRSYFHS